MPTLIDYIAAAALAIILCLCVVLLFQNMVELWKRGSSGRWVFLIGLIGLTLYGGAKHTGSISYPYTDPEIRYLTDAGSYVTNGVPKALAAARKRRYEEKLKPTRTVTTEIHASRGKHPTKGGTK